MKNVLVVYYSQSGQLLEIAKNVTKDLESSEEVNVSFYEIKLKEDFPFPWTKNEFYDTFPETFLQIPSELADLDNSVLKQKYDLVILAYQVWYLSPAIPINSFLKNGVAKELLKDTPIITLIGARNMWIQAQEKVKRLLVANNANLVGHIALVDRHINHISVITIVHWMFNGDKNKRFMGFFPKPGVSQKDIDESTKFSPVVLNHLLLGKYDAMQNNLLDLGAIKIKPFLVLVDKRANVIFSKWANFIHNKGRAKGAERRSLVMMFSRYLMFAIWFIAPIVFVLFLLTYVPLIGKINKDKKYFSSVQIKKS
ncbi:MAG: dialkylresorcinol condensing enzyme DarA [Urechidicola sp.]|nr:dialkylresorcinol condensing enzyme DarA [Urechidicola sp.]